ncbi:ABC-type bacteriocin/lantibiotic exporter with double-glycine peptidase domain [Thermococcus stetteri]|nr:ABC-type bacteriocin/lantibiotic exporter with double-glycine peptidase domain [Thermococcus stetteri]
MKEYVRLLFLLRLFLRVFAFGYPLFLTVMYNFWVFLRIPSWVLVVYIALMGVIELTVFIFSRKPWIGALTKVYVVLAVVFEFPSSIVELLVSGRTYGYASFFGWALLWYLPP